MLSRFGFTSVCVGVELTATTIPDIGPSSRLASRSLN
jgi:hypothetical protein